MNTDMATMIRPLDSQVEKPLGIKESVFELNMQIFGNSRQSYLANHGSLSSATNSIEKNKPELKNLILNRNGAVEKVDFGAQHVYMNESQEWHRSSEPDAL